MKDNINVTDIVEYTFCKKFPYYSIVLGIPQYEGTRGTVLKGRQHHETRATTNRNYIPHGIEGKKLIGNMLYSKLGYSGKIDEAIESDTTILLVERKYSDNTSISDILKVQLGLLAFLLEENFGKRVNVARVIFERQIRVEIDVQIDNEIRSFAIKQLEAVLSLVRTGVFPAEKYDNRCVNCCYRKLCPVGSLKRSE